MKNIFILLITMIFTLSCIPKNTSNKRSPCASIESNNPYAINPCVKRPLNANRLV